ncbi:hypothetical protein ELH39_08015 [Rhizobium ruizarguesonis]|uniref:hypothetical protein n=1 Tax=Rhizobium ruizarguesonis TaxID=2081791 RepID=UPI001030520F|nr:hypothetical protein [Rhizobium ruizarguesonis]TBB97191.1 hypothetical protein ELH39_08015 [Rhizobium ruizarguesonis]
MSAFRYSQFVKLPTEWIEKRGLHRFRWSAGGSDHAAALLVLIAIAHRIDDEGVSKITYDEIQRVVSMSRAKVAAGINVLVQMAIIKKHEDQSVYTLCGFNPFDSWAKLPAKGLYRDGAMYGFSDFNLRKPVELNALKLYLLFVSRRDRTLNLALISYDKITDYTGIPREQIKAGISLLTIGGLLHVDRVRSWESRVGKANAYRVTHIEPSVHRGTIDVDEELERRAFERL